MASYNLTSGTDTLTGTTGNDVFTANAYLTPLGILTSTLQQFDTIDGGAGTDTLVAALIADTSYAGQPYNARPTLTNIENVMISAYSPLSGSGDTAQSTVTLDLFNSSGITTLTNRGSNTLTRITNAGSIVNYAVQNMIADDPEDAFIVTGITRSAINVSAINIQRDGDLVETLRFSTKSGAELNMLNLTLTNADILLDAPANNLTLVSAGGASVSRLTSTDASYTNITLSGAGALTIDTGAVLYVARAIDASAMTGSLTIEPRIFNINSYKGSAGADNIYISTITDLPLVVALGTGDNVAQIGSSALSTTVTSLGGKDHIDVGSIGKLVLDSGAGEDYVIVSNMAPGGVNSLRLGDGNDFLHLFVAPDLDASDGFADILDGGAGTRDEIRFKTYNLTAQQGAQIKNFEILSLMPSGLSTSGNIDMAGLPTINTLRLGDEIGYFANIKDNTHIYLANGLGQYFDPGVNDTTTNSLTFHIGTAATPLEPGLNNQGDTMRTGVWIAQGGRAVESINVVSEGGFVAPATSDQPPDFSSDWVTGDYNLMSIMDGPGLTKITISGNEDLMLSVNAGTTTVTTINAATLNGRLDLTGDFDRGEDYRGVIVSSAGATITGGKRDDILTGGAGADTFALSAGGKDVVFFRMLADSEFGSSDRIGGFTGGDDKLSFNGDAGAGGIFQGSTDVTEVLLFSQKTPFQNADTVITLDYGGNQNGIAAVQDRIATMHALAPTDYASAYDTQSRTFYIDSNQDGLLSSADVAIVLTGTPTIAFYDLMLV